MIKSYADTLIVDSARLAAWRQDDDYAYERELVPSQKSLSEWILGQIERFMETVFGSSFYHVHASTIWITVAVVAFLAIGYFLFRHHPELFIRSNKIPPVRYEITDDNIYGVDFQIEIDKAMERKDYREVLRLIYLQTLRMLSDNHLLDWQPFKTPTQYVYEWRNADFKQMTNLFIRIRYGNFEASYAMTVQMGSLQKAVKNSVLQNVTQGRKEDEHDR